MRVHALLPGKAFGFAPPAVFGGEPPVMDESLAFVEADGQVGVAEVNGEEHGLRFRTVDGGQWTIFPVYGLPSLFYFTA